MADPQTAVDPVTGETERDDDYQIAADNWKRFQYGLTRGHKQYTETAAMLEGFYMGGGYDRNGNLLPGGHWNQADLDKLQAEGRPAYEVSQIKPGLDSAFGYQIANRMDISFRPRSGDATKEVADVRSKVAMQIADNNQLHWKETEVFADGMIEQRGYYDVRFDYDDSVLGELRITVLDPRDVIPDPDAKNYDPKHWADVIVGRYLSMDSIEGLWGVDARKKAESYAPAYKEEDFGNETSDGASRNKFGNINNYDGWYMLGKVLHVQVIERQKWVREMTDVAISQSGDVRPLGKDSTPEVMQGLIKSGAMITKRMVKRVRWQVSTCNTLLLDEWSPYDRFTVIPFFPFFRRGKTRGMVDGAIGGQKIFDKALSKAVEIVSSTSNSGWQLEENQLTNMATDDLETKGASPGLILERKPGTPPLTKIQSNPMPQGMDKLIEIASQAIKDVTVPDAMRGVAEPGEAGITNQSRQHASQQILAVPLDNLTRTRHMLAEWIDYGISSRYDSPRVFRITKTNPLTGREEELKLPINQPQGDGTYLNDMTAGEYDVVIAEQPMQITFDNSQYTQLMEMRKEGIRIPDVQVVKHSNVTDKADIIQAMEGAGAPPQDPTLQAKAELLAAQKAKVEAETVQVREEAQFSAIQTAKEIVAVPEIAVVADQVYKSGGGVDQDQPPVFALPPPGTPIGTPPDVRQNTSPLFPPKSESPAVGTNQGIEGGV